MNTISLLALYQRYADRMIGLQSKAEMDAACGPSIIHPDGTHGNGDCNCTGAGGGPSKWAVYEDRFANE
jgi:hypothetical protein